MTHDQLVARAGRWLRGRKHVVVLHEIGTDGRELPDVLGWTHRGVCTLIECKTTRSDFLRDAKKHFRTQHTGMGTFRWYAAPKGIIRPEEVPYRWGLVEVGPKQCRIVRIPLMYSEDDRNRLGETVCLISAVQRVTEGWGRKVFGEISPVHGTLDPHPSIGATIKALQHENRRLRTALNHRELTRRQLDLANTRTVF